MTKQIRFGIMSESVLDGPAWADHARRAEDTGVASLLIRDHFSAGANVEMFIGRDEAAARELLERFLPMIRRFAEIPVPTGGPRPAQALHLAVRRQNHFRHLEQFRRRAGRSHGPPGLAEQSRG